MIRCYYVVNTLVRDAICWFWAELRNIFVSCAYAVIYADKYAVNCRIRVETA